MSMDPKNPPWAIIQSALKEMAPVVVAPLMQHLNSIGFNLGPIPPDIRPSMKIVDAEIDAEIAKMKGGGP